MNGVLDCHEFKISIGSGMRQECLMKGNTKSSEGSSESQFEIERSDQRQQHLSDDEDDQDHEIESIDRQSPSSGSSESAPDVSNSINYSLQSSN